MTQNTPNPVRALIVVQHETLAESIAKDVGTALMLFALIGVGIVLQSNALQFFGGVMAILFMGVRGIAKRKFLTLPEARAELDRIEAARPDLGASHARRSDL